MERFFRLFIAMSLTIMCATSFVSSGLAPLTRIHLLTTTKVREHPQLLLIQSRNIDANERTQTHGGWQCYSTNEPNDKQASDDTELKKQVEVTADSLTPSQIQSLSPDSQSSSFLGTLKSFFSNKNNKFSRESLGKLGMSALLAYGFVSNVSGVIAVSCAWFIFCTRVSCCLCHYCCLFIFLVRTCAAERLYILSHQTSHRLYTQLKIRRVSLPSHLGKKQHSLASTLVLQ
jgi:hypothetical protein